MQNATRDLLRLSMTAAAIAGFFVCVEFTPTSLVSPRSEALAKTDAILHVRSISSDRVVALPTGSPFAAIVADAPPRVSVAKPRPAHRILLALEQ